MKGLLRGFMKDVAILALGAVVFSALFILGHLTIHQEWPRWK